LPASFKKTISYFFLDLFGVPTLHKNQVGRKRFLSLKSKFSHNALHSPLVWSPSSVRAYSGFFMFMFPALLGIGAPVLPV
jgi:hypothetical protein